MKFIIDHIEYKIPKRRICLEIQNYLDNLKDGQLITTRKLAQEINKAYLTVRHVKIEELKEYKYKRSNMSVVWGNQKTIEEFAKYYESKTAKKI